MFSFFKKEKKQPEKEQPVLSEEEIQRIQKNSLTIQQKIQQQDEADTGVLAKLYEELGLVQAELPDKKAAIHSLEKSLAYKNSIGDGYKKLMSLYNEKRGEAARNGDGDGIEFYMDKMDQMRQIAKKMTISGE